MINSYDIDGVIFMGSKYRGLRPQWDDIIITGRSIDEKEETYAMLDSKGIQNQVFFNNVSFDKKSREQSGEHKASIINDINMINPLIGIHFEDDPIQAEIIRKRCDNVEVVLVMHNLVEKENVRHLEW